MEIKSVADIIAASEEAARKLRVLDVWWRGQECNADWVLRPKAHRDGSGYKRESNMIRRFRQRAPSRAKDTPQRSDLVSWLFLAQHYGLPTRLLDWTELPLVAVFFAVCKGPKSDGTLWALNAGQLNAQSVGYGGLLDPVSGPAFGLFQRPFDEDVAESDQIVGVVTHEVDVRMMVQRSTFTVHGAAAPPLEELPDADKFLLRLDIPADAKEVIFEGLRRVGVTWSNIFPDLEKLAKDISAMAFPPDGVD